MKVTRHTIAAALAAVCALVALTACDDGSGDANNEMNKQGAAVMCQSFVKKELKSPGTAKFSGVTETTIKVLATKKPWKYKVNAWVDSQNSFGGVVRNPYVCAVSAKNADTWRLDSLQFTDPK
ncbi:hypothetical protein [Streptomyces mirabilis]|uniref:hypothetical protein n=1 Tax=Streptomyces mirabilis TaxID=68239 RepID=UPI0036A71AEA